MRRLLYMCMAVCLAAGCLERQLEEPQQLLQSEVVGYAVAADNYSGDTVVDTLVFYSNRSWSAKIVPEDCDWLEIGVNKHSNFSHTTDRVEVPLVFKDNELDEDRLANVVFTTREGSCSVPIRQYAISPRLEVLSDVVVPDILCEDGRAAVKIKSNVSWTVSQDNAHSNTTVSFEGGGMKDGDFTVIFPDNPSYSVRKTAVIYVTGRGCEPKRVTLIQNTNKPFVTAVKIPEEYPAWIPSAKIYTDHTDTIIFRTNSSWVLDTVRISGFKTLAFSRFKGTEADTAIVVTYKDNLAPNPYAGNALSARIRTLAAVPGVPEDTLSFEMSQEAAMVLYMNNGKSSSSPTLWNKIFSSPSGTALGSSSGKAINKDQVTPLVTKTGYSWYAYAKNGLYRNSSQGFCLGGQSYLVFPKVPGKRLTEVTAQSGYGTSYSYYLTTRDKALDANPEDAVPGGESAVIPVGTAHTWTLPDTDPDTEYCVVRSASSFWQYIDLRYE